MKKWLFLRGAVPTDRDPKEIMHDSLEQDDDMWIHLFAELCGDECGWIWYKDFEGINKYKENLFVSKHLPPQVDYVFARGGFDYYNEIIDKCPNAYKIYYGAGRRYLPSKDVYDLVLVDTPNQLNIARLKGFNAKLFIKPAAPHFRPIQSMKGLDLCYIANGPQYRFKGIEWIYKTIPDDISMLHLGIPSKFTPPGNVTTKRVSRTDMPQEISKCRLGIVPYEAIDSCPRVIPEMMACGIPLVCLDTVNFWRDKYPCVVTDKDHFWRTVTAMLSGHTMSDNGEYYKKNLSVKIAADHIKELINK